MKMNRKILGGLAALAIATMAMAADYGWNPSTGTEAFHGALISQGTAVAISGCATVSAQVGGASAGKFQSTNVACNPTFTFPSAAPNGYVCVVQDQVTPTIKITQTSFTTTTAVFTASGTTVSGDTYVFSCMGF